MNLLHIRIGEKMKKKIAKITNSKYFDYVIDLILCTGLLVQDTSFLLFGTPCYKYVVVLLFILLSFYYLINKKEIKVGFLPIILLVIMYAYSFIIGFNKSYIVPSVFFIVEVTTFILYLQSINSTEELRKRIFNIILFVATILSLFAVIQYVAYNLDLKIIYNSITQHSFYLAEGRITSIYSEPAHLCSVLGGGLFVCLYYIWTEKGNIRYYLLASLILIVSLYSKSFVTYLTIALFIVLYYFSLFLIRKNKNINKKGIAYSTILMLSISIVFFLFLSDSNSIEVMDDKVKSIYDNNYGVVDVIKNESEQDNDLDNVELQKKLELQKQQDNLTGFAVISNYNIAIEKLKDGYVLGTGIFSHLSFYDKYMSRIYPTAYIRINYTDACSIFLRVFSEFGIIGLLIYLIMLLCIFANAVKRKDIFMLFMLWLYLTQSMRLGDYNWFINCLGFIFLLSTTKFYQKYTLVVNMKRHVIKIKS